MSDQKGIDEFVKKVEIFLTALPQEVARVNDGIALSIIPDITERLISKGVDGKGKAMGQYSTNPLPSFFFKHKGLGSGADEKFAALEKRKRKAEGEAYKGVSYKEFRELNNRPTDHVTLSFSGDTLSDIGVISERQEGNVIITTIGARGTKTKAKYDASGAKKGENTSEQILDFLGERYGNDLLTVNAQEEEFMATILDDELQMLVNKYLG